MLRPEAMVHPPECHLLAGGPEVRDEDLAGIVVPVRNEERERNMMEGRKSDKLKVVMEEIPR